MKESCSGWTLLCLLLVGQETAGLGGASLQCRVSPAGAGHPVGAELETWGAGPGCAAREQGATETHVIAVGRATKSPDRQVTVLLRPLSPSKPRPSKPRPMERAVILVLSSQQAVHWWLEAERLPPSMSVLVQVSPNSSVRSDRVPIRVELLTSLPFRPRALLHWALHRHGNISSFTHTPHATRVYLRLGEDPMMPSVCRLQSLFLSHSYLTSDLQTQAVHGCLPSAGNSQQEVHVIRLLSAGSGLCGSLQVEVSVSLLPPVAGAGWCRVVLVLSSAAPVNWALSISGLHGHISVYSSNSVSPLHPEEVGLTLTSRLTPDLASTPDLLAWANQTGFPAVTSYTEADLANRFVIRLGGGGADKSGGCVPGSRHPWVLTGGVVRGVSGGVSSREQEAVSVQCQDGRLNVAVDRHTLQALSLPVGVITLKDPQCQASSNDSHFLLVFPVISCGTEGLLQREPHGVTYRNMVLLWRQHPEAILGHNQTEERKPLAIWFSCFAATPSPPSTLGPVPLEPGLGPGPDLLPLEPGLGPGPDPLPLEPGLGPGPGPLPQTLPRPGPHIFMELFVTERYEKREPAPCSIIANNRVYVEVSALGGGGGVDVRSCEVSPFPPPRASPSWGVIRDGCSSDPSLALSSPEEEEEDQLFKNPGRLPPIGQKMAEGGREWRMRVERSRWEERVEQTHRLRFSFVLHAVHNNSIQFLHCVLRVCSPGVDLQGATPRITAQPGCQGALVIPALLPPLPSQQCEPRILYRPMIVTEPQTAGRPPAPPPGQRPSQPRLPGPSPDHSSGGVDTGPLLGIVFAAFLMGVTLMGALWYIHTHTGSAPSIRRGSLLDPVKPGQDTWSPPRTAGGLKRGLPPANLMAMWN